MNKYSVSIYRYTSCQICNMATEEFTLFPLSEALCLTYSSTSDAHPFRVLLISQKNRLHNVAVFHTIRAWVKLFNQRSVRASPLLDYSFIQLAKQHSRRLLRAMSVFPLSEFDCIFVH